jgi:hypothetical protein
MLVDTQPRQRGALPRRPMHMHLLPPRLGLRHHSLGLHTLVLHLRGRGLHGSVPVPHTCLWHIHFPTLGSEEL